MKQSKTDVKTDATAQLPDWANDEVFQITSTDDVLSSFYAPAPAAAQTSAKEQTVSRNQTAAATAVKSKPEPEPKAAALNKNEQDVQIEKAAQTAAITKAETPVKTIPQPAAAQTSTKTPDAKKPISRNLLGKKRQTAAKIAVAANSASPQIQPRAAINLPPQLSLSLSELLPGKALDLYLALYKETHSQKPARQTVRLTKNDLRQKAGIMNAKTLNTHEKYLLAAQIIRRHTRAGDQSGSTYEVRRLDEIGVDTETLQEFETALRAG